MLRSTKAGHATSRDLTFHASVPTTLFSPKEHSARPSPASTYASKERADQYPGVVSCLPFSSKQAALIATVQGSLLSLLSSMSSLEEVQVDIHGIPPGRPGENDCVVAGDIVPVLTHLPAQDALHTLTFRLWVIQNRRRHFLRALIRREVDGLLGKFPNLTSLAFQLPECSGSRYDRKRWESLLSDHLPRLRRTVTITVTICWDEMYACLDHREPCHVHRLDLLAFAGSTRVPTGLMKPRKTYTTAETAVSRHNPRTERVLP